MVGKKERQVFFLARTNKANKKLCGDYNVSVVSMGNPHFIIFVDDLLSDPDLTAAQGSGTLKT